MIQETITYHCHVCGSTHIVRNGTNKCGNAQYHCHDCNAYRVLHPRIPQAQAKKEEILRAYQERCSLRGVERIFHVARQTVSRWIREAIQPFPSLEDTLLPSDDADVLELDELWSFVLKKDQKRWLWLALCRRTRQIVACVIGDRSAQTCARLWGKIPQQYKRCHSFSDFWQAYQLVFDEETHQSVGKESGETAHIERFNGILRQRLARFVRKTLSFSKSDTWHHIVTRWFIIEYNLDILRRALDGFAIPISLTV